MYAQLVIGPPGSGKSTYCHGMKQFLTAIGRDVSIINLDPANENLPYQASASISSLITLEDVMSTFDLGPNGGLLYCMEYLAQNMDWLKNVLTELKGKYILFDLPGQVELYTHHAGMRSIITTLQSWSLQLVAIHLVDAHHCSDASKFISVLLVSLSTMCQLELPHVNVLSKMDLIQQYGTLPFGLDFYTEVLDLDYLIEHLSQDPFHARYRKLNAQICHLVQSFNLVVFSPLAIQDKESVWSLVKVIDKANGYIFAHLDRMPNTDMTNLVASGEREQFDYDHLQSIQEKYMPETSEGTNDDIKMAINSASSSSTTKSTSRFATQQRAKTTSTQSSNNTRPTLSTQSSSSTRSSSTTRGVS